MTITLTAELENLINEKVKSGAYPSDEVIAASLRLLEARALSGDAITSAGLRSC